MEELVYSPGANQSALSVTHSYVVLAFNEIKISTSVLLLPPFSSLSVFSFLKDFHPKMLFSKAGSQKHSTAFKPKILYQLV